MSVQSEITRLENAKAAIKAAIEGKGVTVPDATLLDGMAALIESIEAGGGGNIVYTSGTFTLTSDTTCKGYVLTHDLGIKPDIFILTGKYDSSTNYALKFYLLIKEGIRNAGYTESNFAYAYANRGNGMYQRTGLGANSSSIDVNESSITLSDLSLAILAGGLLYSWIAIGGF